MILKLNPVLFGQRCTEPIFLKHFSHFCLNGFIEVTRFKAFITIKIGGIQKTYCNRICGIIIVYFQTYNHKRNFGYGEFLRCAPYILQ